MTRLVPAAGIFVSYRREQSGPQAGRLFDLLVARFGEAHVFMDVDSIGFGLDFVRVIEDAVSSCVVLLAVIGPNWLDAVDEMGNRRIDQQDDFVRIEIETALKRNIRVVPILLNGAELPARELLPAGMQQLTRRQALRLDDATFRSDVRSLIEQLARVLGPEPDLQPRGPEPETAVPPRQSKAKAKSRAPSAELVAREPRRLALRVTLNEESHIVEAHVGRWAADWLTVDGHTVWKSSPQGAFPSGPIDFVLTDGDRQVPAQGAFGLNWSGQKLTRAVIVVENSTVYRE